MDRPLIIGIGNEFRGDDAYGVLMVQQLSSEYPGLADYMIESDDLTRLVDRWKHRNVIFIDAYNDTMSCAGAIFETDDITKLKSQNVYMNTTHGIDFSSILEISEALKKMPDRLIYYGVNGQEWQLGKPMTKPVKKSFSIVKAKILARLNPAEWHAKKFPQNPNKNQLEGLFLSFFS